MIPIGRPTTSKARTQWHARANLPIVAWLVALVVVTFIHPFVEHATWLLVHTLMLGVVTNAIVVWSSHFAETLSRSTAAGRDRQWQTVRLVALNLAIIAVIGGRMAEIWLLLLAGSVLIGLVIVWHGFSIVRRLRNALANRFATTLNYYVVAACALPIGAGLGAWLAHEPTTSWAGQATLAHASLNVLGWVGLTVAGTLVTLWPTILRTRIAENAERATRLALPFLAGGVVVMVTGALIDQRFLGAAGLLVYIVGWGIAMGPWILEAKQRPPHSFAAWSLLAAVAWLLISLFWWLLIWLTESSIAVINAGFSTIVAALAAGFAAQVVLGAMSHLIPVVLGGGPQATRAAHEVLDRGAGLRLVVINVGLAICLLEVPSIVRVIVSSLVLIAFIAFLPLAALAVRASRRARGQVTAPRDREESRRQIAAAQHPSRHRSWAAAGMATLAIAVAVGIALDPSGLPGQIQTADASVTPTGETTRVEVEARGMRYFPDSVDVPVGNRLVIEVKNTDKADAHDLFLESGHRTKRLAPGESETLDAGVVGKNVDGWCTVVGHRQMGMVFTVNAIGDTNQARGDTGGDAAEQDRRMMPSADGSGAAADLDFMAEPPDDFVARDPRAPKTPSGDTHRHTLRVSDTVAEVAPGVKQTLWTYNQTSPAPTLRGKVGDQFVITLINDTKMAHSIDFHASQVAPDRLMKSIGPGEELEYTFTATNSGIWMYHCGTMPMGVHIASGLYGAVIIDPPNLEKVDREYLMIQSEMYLGEQGGLMDASKLAAEKPDAVVFNGYVNQYSHRPLKAKVGERVRFWVLDVGPNRPTSFHMIGSMFDTVWFEGDYQLRPDNESQGASQALGLQAAQGGFVELTFAEPGRYPFVSHVMIDGERGAHGFVDVTR